jgi:hypothetical protein
VETLPSDIGLLLVHCRACVSQEDTLVLEDESGRIALGGERMLVQVGQLVTGVVVAVKGSVDDNGVMNVSLRKCPTDVHLARAR